MVLRSVFKATFMYAHLFVVVQLLDVSESPTRTLSQLSGMSSNQYSVLYPALKYSETRYKLPKQLIYTFAEFHAR
jgi:hypothetical protein